MARDEKGYIQFHCDWESAPPFAGPAVEPLVAWRDRMYRLGLIGLYPDGIGYGNISARLPVGFLISGTATGGLTALGAEHFAEVTAYDFATNRLRCRGAVRASSESLSHAAVYASDPTANVVIHVHHLGMWERFRDHIPTTDSRAEAGTPEMAWAIEELLRRPGVREGGLFVMGGHREGLMAFGRAADEAGRHILEALEKYSYG